MANDFPSDKSNKKAYYVNARNIFSHKNSAGYFASNSAMSIKLYFVFSLSYELEMILAVEDGIVLCTQI